MSKILKKIEDEAKTMISKEVYARVDEVENNTKKSIEEVRSDMEDFQEVIDETAESMEELKKTTAEQNTQLKQAILEAKKETEEKVMTEIEKVDTKLSSEIRSVKASIKEYNDEELREDMQEKMESKAEKDHKHDMEDVNWLTETIEILRDQFATKEELNNLPKWPVSVGGYTKWVRSVTAWSWITVDNTDPRNPVISTTGWWSWDVTWPASSTDNAITRFDSTTWKVIQNSTVTLDDDWVVWNVDAIQFDLTPTTSTQEEWKMYRNVDDGTLNLWLPWGNVNLQIGQELHVPKRVKNNTGWDFSNWNLVYISGGDWTNLYVDLADNTDEAKAHWTIAMLTEDITAGQKWYATTFWLVRGTATQPVDTSAYTVGQNLYLWTSGTFTGTAPTSPNHRILVWQVYRVHATEWAILVNIHQWIDLKDIDDVLITSVWDGQVLQYNSGTWVWENVDPQIVPYYIVWPNSVDYQTDWTADDVQIQAAIDAASSAWWWTVLIDEWTYVISTAITLENNVNLLWVWGTILQAWTNLNSYIIDLVNVTDNVEIRWITFDGNKSNQSSNCDSLGRSTAVQKTNVKVINCKFINTKYFAIQADNRDNSLITWCYFSGWDYVAVRLHSTDSTRVENCYFSLTWASYAWVYCDGRSNVITWNTFYLSSITSLTAAFMMAADGTYRVDWNVFSNNTIKWDAVTTNLYGVSHTGTYSQNNIITWNAIENVDIGISWCGANWVISNNTLKNFNRAIQFSTREINSYVSGNVAYNDTKASQFGMRVYSTTNITVVWNKYINCQYWYYEQDSASANLIIGNTNNNVTTWVTIVWTSTNYFNDWALLPIASLATSTTSPIWVWSIELWHASDTTVSRVSAWVLAIEWVNIVTTSSTDTLTNKEIDISANTVTVDGTNEVWFRNIPQNSKSAAYTTVLADAGKHIYHPSADTTARTFTIDSNANVAYPIGTAITFVNDTSAWTVTIAITSDTLVLAGDWSTGSRTLAANWVATAIKVTSTRRIISGTNLT